MKPAITAAPVSAELRAARQRSLGVFFAPRTVAVIGTSGREGSVGRSLLENLHEFVIVTPAETVPGIVRECVGAGVSGVIIHSAGFNESGTAGAELERQVMSEARR